MSRSIDGRVKLPPEIVLVWLLLMALSLPAGPVNIQRVEPTPFFPRPAANQPLRQQVRLCLVNAGPPIAAQAAIQAGDAPAYLEDLPGVPTGNSTNDIYITDIETPTKLTIQVRQKDSGDVLARQELDWRPQKKWDIYSVSYSHQDLGFGDYPHRIRTTIRHANLRLALQFCRETDHWPDEAKFRFNIETSEPITSFISFYGKESALELARRIREGRIQLLALHNTANTEQLNPELMARLFYLSCRHAPDLLAVPPAQAGADNDVIGLTWPLATYAHEAGITHFFHGFNRLCMPNIEDGKILDSAEQVDGEQGRPIFSIAREPLFYWQGPDGQQLLRRATTYPRHSLLWDTYEPHPSDVQDPRRVELLIRGHEKIGWPFSAMLAQDGEDFMLVKRTIANRARAWNAQYAYPRIISATFDMFFHTIEREIQRGVFQPKSIALDENNQWSDQDYNDAWLAGQARRMGEALPITETLATLAQALGGAAYPWADIYQAYHRLLQYHEHTDAGLAPGNTPEYLRQYETELEENREMVAEAEAWSKKARARAIESLNRVITRASPTNLVVFNPLARARTDIVRCPGELIPVGLQVVEAASGARLPVQRLADGACLFLAAEVPALGYRSYRLEPAMDVSVNKLDIPITTNRIENQFYRLELDRDTGNLKSLFDKQTGVELVDSQAPYRFNQYLYCQAFLRNGKWEKAWESSAKADEVSIQSGPVADLITVSGKAKGVAAFRQTIYVYKALPRIEFNLWLDKLPFSEKFDSHREGVLVALPFAVPGFAIHHELPGAVVDPYRQLAEGSATDHFTIHGFTDFSNDKFGVTISPIEGSLVCYGKPQVAPQPPWHGFNRSQKYPEHSHLFLYLLNNMFGVNTRVDQRGPVSFSWALRGHSGGWRAGAAADFGQAVLQPLIAWRADGRNQGSWPAQGGFLTVDAANVACGVIKPAEANGPGFILRFRETGGREVTTRIALPFLPPIASASETSLVEVDRPVPLSVREGNILSLTLRPFGVKTVRVMCGGPPARVTGLKAEPLSNRQVRLSWTSGQLQPGHFNVYRDPHPECEPTLLSWVGQCGEGTFVDQPQLNPGGWIRNQLEPATTYYYRVVPVSQWNISGAPSEAIQATTLAITRSNLPPMRVEGLRAIPVSPLARFNFVNLLFRTACESDVTGYEIHRSLQRGFRPSETTLIGRVNSADIIPGSSDYGHTPLNYRVRDFDHAMFADHTVQPGLTYYYQVRAVNAAGQKGACSAEAIARTKDVRPSLIRTSASSIWSNEYGAEAAIDGNPDPNAAWITKPYGGGTKENPADAWLIVEFPRRITLSGVTIVGDGRSVIPLQKNLRIESRKEAQWAVAAEVRGATEKTIRCRWPAPIATSAIRVFVPAADLPKSEQPGIPDGVVRVCELLLVLPDGREVMAEQAFPSPR